VVSAVASMVAARARRVLEREWFAMAAAAKEDADGVIWVHLEDAETGTERGKEVNAVADRVKIRSDASEWDPAILELLCIVWAKRPRSRGVKRCTCQ
jgi:hypothetical protein